MKEVSEEIKVKKIKKINVLMIGGRRAGKTSILAAVDKCCTETLRGQNDIKIEVKQGTGSLVTKQKELKTYFTNPIYKKRNYFVPDLNPSSDLEEYEYEVHIKKSKYTFTFTDVPGEAYSPERPGEDIKIKQIRAKLPDLIAKNHVLIIAVDTPHLMERPYEEGVSVCKYHKEFNRVNEITDLIKENFIADEKKLVIFVPLKCEKYYYKGKMDKIPESIEKGYPELFDHFKSSGPDNRFSVIIDPILTIGGAEFFEFEDDPRSPGFYNYVENVALRKYSPKYCDNPMFLMTLYLIQMAKASKNSQNILSKWFGESIFGKASYNDLVGVEKTIKEYITDNLPEGFEVVQDPVKMEV